MISIRKHEVGAYLILTFLSTWLFWSISFTSTNQTISGIFRIVGSFMPSVVAVVFSGCIYGKNEIKDLLKKITIWKVPPFFYVFVCFYTVASIFIPSLFCTFIGLNYKMGFVNQIPGFPFTNPLLILLSFFAVMFFGGPVGEELGWRGFILPRLQNRFHPLLSSILLGCIWSCWHIPMFVTHTAGYEISFVRYLLETIWLTILFTWLYNHTKGSLLIPILFHSVDNFILALCYCNFMNEFNFYTMIWYTMRLVVLLCVIFDMYRKNTNVVKR